MDIYDRLVKDIYKRASYLKCYKDEFMNQFRRENTRVSISNVVESQQVSQTIPEASVTSAPALSKQGTKIAIEDPAILMMKNIMK